MEEAVVKQGVLHLQLQQTFGKKWRKFWGVLYRESSCSTARLELFEGSAPPAAEKLRKGEGSKRLVKLSDCVHVAEASGDAGCPKDTVPFLLETTDKRYLLAADGTEVADWIQKLCELAFPRRREEQAAGKDGRQNSLGTDGEFSMEENSLYSSRDKAGLEQTFEVTVRATESSERCRLWGRCILRAGEEALELRDFQSLEILYSWPYRFLRRFGRDKVTFSFEAGRRCASGEGNFEFETRQGNEIFQVIESAITCIVAVGAEEPRRGGPGDDVSRPLGHAKMPSWAQGQEEPGGTKGPSLEPTWEGKVPKAKLVMPPSSSPGTGEPLGAFLPSHGAECPYTEPCNSLRWGNPPVTEKGRRQNAPAKAATDSEYAIPFDTIAKTFVARKFSNLAHCPKEVPDPFYDSIKEVGGQVGKQSPPPPAATKPDHIYDEPEGLSTHTVYDEPEEVKGEAWRLQAAPEDPSGHEYPYNPQRDDYAVPKRPVPLRQPFLLQGKEWLGDTEYDNVALKFAKRRNLQ
ncbi:LOW QUALITY PROTEIN: docking protein 2 [Tyto alba]|uniref:LOW QUALITY PROTEIN: docking protein 2 n=1 Tax=Tyto alba TaxID=56313 RepID=UPI001C68273D|nr:LOW QUALITY PROTEIN: docking protein 2 [Tyto alba]